jgi:HlyD family secretion protein
MRKQQGPIALLALALALGSCTFEQPAASVASVPTVPTVPPATPTPAVAPATYTVQRGEVVEALHLKGRVAASLDQDVFAATSGNLRALHVKPDERVTSGQLLAELDIGDLPQRLEQAQADLQATERATSSAQRQRALAVAMARIQLQNAEDNLARLQAGTSPEKLAAAQNKIDRARIGLEDSRNSLSAAKTNAQLGVERAANALRSAQDAYSQVVWANGNRPLDQLDVAARTRQEQALRAVDDAEHAVRSAQVSYDLAVENERNGIDLGERDIKLAQQEYDQLLAPPSAFDLRAAERDVATSRISLQVATSGLQDPTTAARIEQSKMTIAELESEAAKAKIYAPFDGIVSHIGVQLGDKVAAYDAIMNVIDPTRLVIVVADIGAKDLAQIAANQPVTLSLSRYPGEAIPGRVERLPSDQSAPGSMVRADPLLRISFDPAGRALDVGDVAGATIVFQNEPNALWLPPPALFEFDQRTFVVLQDGEQKRQVDVIVGIRTPERVQILSGLKEGDVVIGPTDLTTAPATP